MKELILMIGNVGAGKSTMSKSLMDADTLYVSIDEIGKEIESIHGNLDMHKVNDWINKLIFGAIDKCQRIIFDGNLMTRQSRNIYCTYANSKGYEVLCYDFGPGNEIQLQRRINESPQLTEIEWRSHYNDKYNIYEKPELSDIIHEIIDKTQT